MRRERAEGFSILRLSRAGEPAPNFSCATATRSGMEQAYFGTEHYFGSKRSAIFLASSSCQGHEFCLASRLKAGLPGW